MRKEDLSKLTDAQLRQRLQTQYNTLRQSGVFDKENNRAARKALFDTGLIVDSELDGTRAMRQGTGEMKGIVDPTDPAVIAKKDTAMRAKAKAAAARQGYMDPTMLPPKRLTGTGSAGGKVTPGMDTGVLPFESAAELPLGEYKEPPGVMNFLKNLPGAFTRTAGGLAEGLVSLPYMAVGKPIEYFTAKTRGAMAILNNQDAEADYYLEQTDEINKEIDDFWKGLLGGEQGIAGKTAAAIAYSQVANDPKMAPEVRSEAGARAERLKKEIPAGVGKFTYEEPFQQILNATAITGVGGVAAASGKAAQLRNAASAARSAGKLAEANKLIGQAMQMEAVAQGIRTFDDQVQTMGTRAALSTLDNALSGKSRGYRSVKERVGKALERPITKLKQQGAYEDLAGQAFVDSSYLKQQTEDLAGQIRAASREQQRLIEELNASIRKGQQGGGPGFSPGGPGGPGVPPIPPGTPGSVPPPPRFKGKKGSPPAPLSVGGTAAPVVAAAAQSPFIPLKKPVGKVTDYGYADDATGDSYTRAGKGKWNDLEPDVSHAVRIELERQLRAEGIKPKDWVEYEFSDGRTWLGRWDDKIPTKGSGGALDIYFPRGSNSKGTPFRDAQITGFRKVDPPGTPRAVEPGPTPDAIPPTLQAIDNELAAATSSANASLATSSQPRARQPESSTTGARVEPGEGIPAPEPPAGTTTTLGIRPQEPDIPGVTRPKSMKPSDIEEFLRTGKKAPSAEPPAGQSRTSDRILVVQPKNVPGEGAPAPRLSPALDEFIQKVKNADDEALQAQLQKYTGKLDELRQKKNPTEQEGKFVEAYTEMRKAVEEEIQSRYRMDEPEADAPEAKPEPAAPAPPARKVPDLVKRHVALSDTLAEAIRKAETEGPVGWREITRRADEAFGGSEVSGKYTARDMYDALEVAVNRRIREDAADLFSLAPEDAIRKLRALEDRLPTQTNRTPDQVSLQQFSTPPTQAYIAARALGDVKGKAVFEPSAGTGSLASMAKLKGAAVSTNEHVHPGANVRAGLLEAQEFPVTRRDAERIDAFLKPGEQYDAVLMNPPFSSTGGRVKTNKTEYGRQHLESAMRSVKPGGRLVAIVGEGMGDATPTHAAWFDNMARKYTYRANILIDGKDAYAKYGTNYNNRIIVFDNEPGNGRGRAIVRDEPVTLEEANRLIGELANEKRPARTGDAGKTEAGPEPSAADVGRKADAEPAKPGADSAQDLPPSAPARQPGREPGEGSGPDAERLAPEADNTPARNAEPAVSGEPAPGRRPARRTTQPDRPETTGDVPGGVRPAATESRTDGSGPVGDGDGAGARDRGADGSEPGARPTAQPDGKGSQAATAERTPGGDAGVPVALQKEPWQYLGKNAEGKDVFLNSEGNRVAVSEGSIAYSGRKFRGRPDSEYPETYQIVSPPSESIQPATLSLRELEKNEDGFTLDSSVTKTHAPEKSVAIQKGKRDEAAAAATDDDTFKAYQPAFGVGNKHPATLVETGSMAGALSPLARISPGQAREYVKIPDRVLKEGRLSDAQLESVVLAEMSHRQKLPGGKTRGMLIGDGTGVGKGREIAGIISNNWAQGTRKILWVTKDHKALASAAVRDIGNVEGWKVAPDGDNPGTPNIPVTTASQTESGTAVNVPEGVYVVSYDTLWREGRLPQVTEWLRNSGDAAPLIIFDEAHKAANATPDGRSEASSRGSGVIRLQDALPDARVVYLSATAADRVSNLGFMNRLGLWGQGTPFPEFSHFAGFVNGQGITGMEMMAREMKQLGGYTSRSIAFRGPDGKPLQYEERTTALDADMLSMYNDAADAWNNVLRKMDAAIEEGVLDRKEARNFTTAYWGGHQRFFKSLFSSFKAPDVIRFAEEAIANGEAPVISLEGTKEGMMLQRIAEARREGLDVEDMDFSNKEALKTLVNSLWPTQLHQDVTDRATGKTVPTPVWKTVDEAGNEQYHVTFARPAESLPVEDPAKVEIKNDVMGELQDLRVPGNLLDEIILHFGADNVAELTGRAMQLVRDANGNVVQRKRSKPRGKGRSQNEFEMNEFNAGRRKLAIINNAAAEGISLHAGKDFKNQKPRVMILAELSWVTKDEVQKLGRVHRSDQVSGPRYVLWSIDVAGDKRFSSSLASKLSAMGAIGRGDRSAAGGGKLAQYDFNNVYGESAVKTAVSEIDPVDKLRMGIRQDDFDKLPGDEALGSYFNRLMTLPVEKQNAYYQAFEQRFGAYMERARERGELDVVKDIDAEDIRAVKETTVYTDQMSGAETRYYELEGKKRNERLTWRNMLARTVDKPGEIWRNNRTGKLAHLHFYEHENPLTRATEYRTEVLFPNGTLRRIDAEDARKNWSETTVDENGARLSPAQKEQMWDEEAAKVPEFRTEKYHVLSGITFPIFDRIHGDREVVAVNINGERIVGLKLSEDGLTKTLRDLGVLEMDRKDPGSLYALATAEMLGNEKIELAGGFHLVKRNYRGSEALKIFDTRDGYGEVSDEATKAFLRGTGAIETGKFAKKEYFIPADSEAGPAVMERLLQRHAVVGMPRSLEALEQKVKKGKEARISDDTNLVPGAIPESVQEFISSTNEGGVRRKYALAYAEWRAKNKEGKAPYYADYGLKAQVSDFLEKEIDSRWPKTKKGSVPGSTLMSFDPTGAGLLVAGALAVGGGAVAVARKYGPKIASAVETRFTKDQTFARRFDELLSDYVEAGDNGRAAVLDTARNELRWDDLGDNGDKLAALFEETGNNIIAVETQFGKELVRSGLITKEAFQEYDRSYLRRIYAYFENPEAWLESLEKDLADKGMPAELVEALKNKERANWANMTGRDPEAMDTSSSASVPAGRTSRRKFKARNLDAQDADQVAVMEWLGEIRLASARVQRGGEVAAREIGKVRLNRSVARYLGVSGPRASQLRKMLAEDVQNGRVPEPDDFKTPNERLYYYNPDLFKQVDARNDNLRGLGGYVIHRNVYRELTQAEYKPESLAAKALLAWKLGVTVFNFPGAYVGNIAGNLVLAQAGGVNPLLKPKLYARALKSIRSRDELFTQAMKHAEHPYESLRMEVQGPKRFDVNTIYPERPGDRIKAASGALMDDLTGIYGGIDTVFKHAQFIDVYEQLRGMGFSEKEAARNAAMAVERTFPNFRTGTPIKPLRPAVRQLRRGLVPFIAWDASVVPLLARAFAEHPARMAAFPLVARAYEAALVQARLRTQGYEDMEREDKARPEYMNEGFMRLMGKDPNYLDVRVSNPVGGLYFGDNLAEAMFVKMNPALSFLGQVALNHDIMTGQPIRKPGDLPDRQSGQVGAFAARQFIPGVRNAEKLNQAMTGEGPRARREVGPDGRPRFSKRLTAAERVRKAMGVVGRTGIVNLDIDKEALNRRTNMRFGEDGVTLPTTRRNMRDVLKNLEAAKGRKPTREESREATKPYMEQLRRKVDALPR